MAGQSDPRPTSILLLDYIRSRHVIERVDVLIINLISCSILGFLRLIVFSTFQMHSVVRNFASNVRK